MKKVVLLFAVTTVIFSACKKEGATTPDVVTPVGFQWPAGTSDYAPNTNGSTFTFEIVSGSPAVTDSFIYTVIKDTLINALTYRKLQSNKPALAPTYYVNYNAGVITNITYNLNFQNLATIPVVNETILNENVAMNGTWSETLQVPVTGFGNIPVSIVNTVTQKDYTIPILGKDYPATIFVKQVFSLPPGLPLPPNVPATTTVENYLAKGVGLVQKIATASTVKIKRFVVVK